MDAPPRPSPPALSLVARLDNLDFVLNRLEAKQDPTKSGIRSSMERDFLPMNVSVRDTYFKGSLLDRVASLENRLFRLCIEADSTGSANRSMPNHRPVSHHRQLGHVELPEIQEEAIVVPVKTKEKKNKHSNAIGKKSSGKKASGSGKDDNGTIVRKKGKPRNSTFMNILGCTH